jgi:hypothetical protein
MRKIMQLIREKDIALLGKTVGSIAHNAQAPKECVTRRYRFTSSGTCSWITAGAVGVKKDDYVLAVYFGPGFYQYVHEPSAKAEASRIDRFFGVVNGYVLLAASMRLYAHIPFDTGSVEIVPGSNLAGATSTASYPVHSVNVVSGTWAGGDAAGYVVIDARSDYLDAPYTDGEGLQVNGVTVANRTSEPAFGGWVMGEAVNIDGVSTTPGGGLVIVHAAVEAANLVAMVASGLSGYQVPVIAGIDSTILNIKKLSAAPETGAISATIVDFTDLANCTTDETLHVIGLLR